MIESNTHGEVVFRVYRPKAGRVELVASFTNWEESPIALEPESDGWWSITLQLPPGDHEFQYRIDGCEWLGDFAAHGVRLNDFSQWLGLIHIPDQRAEVVVRRRAAAAPVRIASRVA